MTSITESASNSAVSTASAPATAFAGDVATIAPLSANGNALAGSRFHTVTS